jgi:hypothetical protein
LLIFFALYFDTNHLSILYLRGVIDSPAQNRTVLPHPSIPIDPIANFQAQKQALEAKVEMLSIKNKQLEVRANYQIWRYSHDCMVKKYSG